MKNKSKNAKKTNKQQRMQETHQEHFTRKPFFIVQETGIPGVTKLIPATDIRTDSIVSRRPKRTKRVPGKQQRDS